MKVIEKHSKYDKKQHICSFEGYIFCYYETNVKYTGLVENQEAYKGKYFGDYNANKVFAKREISTYYTDFFSYFFYHLDCLGGQEK